MSHELTTNEITGLVEFAFLQSDGEAWHGLGQPMPDGASNDDWTTAAGMAWQVKRSRVRYGEGPSQRTFDDAHVLFRSDTKAPLGIVSPTYKIVQPGEVIAFYRDIAKAGGLELSAAGTIYGGKRFWATAKIGDASPLTLRDKIGGYLLITSSADGSLATEVRRTTVRAVCKNTIAMAFADAKASVKVTHRSVFDPAEVKGFMGLNTAAWDAFKHQVVRLANKPIVTEQAERIVANVLTGGTEITDKVRASAGYGKILGLFAGEGKGATLDGVYGTGWGLLNAFTEYADHHVRARTDENRFVSSQWGPGNDLKTRALAAIVAA